MIHEIFDSLGISNWIATIFTLLGLMMTFAVQLRWEKQKTIKLQREIDELKERLMAR